MLDQDAHVINTGPSPRWIEPAFRVTAGRDPLSLQTITIDRIMPRLVPAILALSRRARYLSYYPFLLAEYQDRQKEPTRTGWSRFVKHREYEFAVAMQLCPRGCGKRASAIVGQDRAGPDARTLTSLLPRRESVESDNGGYGLYYRTPLIDLGIVAPAGTPFGPEEELTPIDIVANAQGRQLADQFRSAISGTRYYREFFNGTQDIPRTVLEDLAEVGCLCRLEEFPEERAAIRSALLDTPDLSSLALVSQEIRLSEVDQRRRSVALILSALGQDPAIAAGPKHDSALRTVIWRYFEEHRKDEGPLAETVGQWAALVAKDVMQDALSSIWSDFCRNGLIQQRADGMSPSELASFIRDDLACGQEIVFAGQSIEIRPDMPAAELNQAIRELAREIGLEELRTWVECKADAIAGLITLLALHHCLPDHDPAPRGWRETITEHSAWQPSVLQLMFQIEEFLAEEPTVADLMEWIVVHRVVDVHESVAYGKLPEFTFRFRREIGLLRFYDTDPSRFGVTDIRRDAICRLTEDLGLWSSEGGIPSLTPEGEEFVGRVFG